MKLELLFKKARRLEPPDNCWTKVEWKITRDEESPGEQDVSANTRLHFKIRKPILTVAAVAAALIVAIQLYPAQAPEPRQTQNLVAEAARLNEFIEETLGDIFVDQSDITPGNDGDQIDMELYLSDQFSNILSTNGDNNA